MVVAQDGLSALRCWVVTSPTGQDGDTDTLELINTEVAARLSRLNEAGRSIDTKAGVLAGFAATAAQFLAGRDLHPVLEGFALAAYGVAFAFAVAALAVRAYVDVPNPRELVNTYARQPRWVALADLVVERVKAIENNAAKHQSKARRWSISLGALVVGLALSVVAVQTGNHDPGSGTCRCTAGGVGQTVTAGDR